MNGFISAKLVSLNIIDVAIFSNAQFDNFYFQLFINEKKAYAPTIIRKTTNRESYLIKLELKEPYQFGNKYYLSFLNFPIVQVDISMAVQFKEFDNLFYYDGNDLGSIYHKDHTDFALWAPLATNVTLLIQNDKGKFVPHNMERTEKGVYRISLKGDYKNRLYNYSIENNGVTRITNDIYGKGSSLNSEHSAVIDFEDIDEMGVVPFENSKIQMVDSIIYETHIRDFTEDKNTNIEEKGKYLGFVEEGKKTKGGNPAGIDYLSFLGITHVQLQPIHDVNNVPEDNPKLAYNWGYDPYSYFAIEGAYSSHPEIPDARIKEFKTLVNKLHKRNIGVIIDVVYNHCYEWLYTPFEATVPGYYFRTRRDGLMSSCSGCGNDFASERPMVRKLIVDSILYLFNQFDIDGLRFDLMGLLDITTMLEIERKVRMQKPNAFLYGEGWNMGLQIPEEERASADNAHKLRNYGFFNDTFRDILKGPNFHDRITEKGFVNGDMNYCYGLEYVMNSSILDLSYNHRFIDANQSINYAECHDNNTLFDKLSKSNPDDDEDTLYQRVRLANELILFSFGVPFFHMGQEIGQSKMGLDNTYNIVKINNMNWDLVDRNFEMVEFFKNRVQLRKNLFKYLSKHEPDQIRGIYSFERHGDDYLKIMINDDELKRKYDELMMIINTNSHKITYEDGNYHAILVGTSDEDPILNRIVISPARLAIMYKIKE